MTYKDLQCEFPDGMVLRLSCRDGAAVEFFERNDADARRFGARDDDAHWFGWRGDALTWEELISRLRAADHWRPVTPAVAGLDALTELRGWFHAALAGGDTETARAVEMAAQALAVVLRIPALSWTEMPADAEVAADAQIPIAEACAEPAVDRPAWIREARTWVRDFIWRAPARAA